MILKLRNAYKYFYPSQSKQIVKGFFFFSAQLRALAQLSLCYWVLSGIHSFIHSSVCPFLCSSIKQGHISLLLDLETYGHASRWPVALTRGATNLGHYDL